MALSNLRTQASLSAQRSLALARSLPSQRLAVAEAVPPGDGAAGVIARFAADTMSKAAHTFAFADGIRYCTDVIEQSRWNTSRPCTAGV